MKKIIYFLLCIVGLLNASCSADKLTDEVDNNGKKQVKIEFVDENGTILDGSRGRVTNGTVSGDGYYAGNADVTVSVTPDAGYKVTSFKGGTTDGSISVDYTAAKSGFFNICNSDWLFTVTIVSAMRTLTVNAGTGGTVSGAGSFEEGTTTTITATPDSGYEFERWEVTSGDATIANPTSATTTVTINSTNSTIAAIYKQNSVSAIITQRPYSKNNMHYGEYFTSSVALPFSVYISWEQDGYDTDQDGDYPTSTTNSFTLSAGSLSSPNSNEGHPQNIESDNMTATFAGKSITLYNFSVDDPSCYVDNFGKVFSVVYNNVTYNITFLTPND